MSHTTDRPIIPHPIAAAEFQRDPGTVQWHDTAVWAVRKKRDRAAGSVPGWEELRRRASELKAHTLDHLPEYLEQFEREALKKGVQVHWAEDAREHNEIVHGILSAHRVTKVVKSKSMLTEECGLNPYLHARGIEVVDSDLGERIVQLAKDRPSHIVMPAIHMRRTEIDEVFQQHLHTRPSNGDEVYLTQEARKHLREHYLDAHAAITGVNFAVAETGAVVVCTNEGNADMGMHAAPLHIACMGLEKVIPRQQDLGVFLRLLARSATGQAVTTYTSCVRRPRNGAEMHIVIVDNGRSRMYGRQHFNTALHCIRCGACMNTCPVYRRSGGHSYGSTVPGPIGSILSPNADAAAYHSLPFASTLCGSCSDVCPVKIDIHGLLYGWRQEIVRTVQPSKLKFLLLNIAGVVTSHPPLYRWSGTVLRFILKAMPLRIRNAAGGAWSRQRELPDVPSASFQEWYRRREKS